MIRRAVRVVVAGACVLSLLLCVGTVWAWWRSGQVVAQAMRASAAGVHVDVVCHDSGIGIIVASHWPGGIGFQAHKITDINEDLLSKFGPGPAIDQGGIGGWSGWGMHGLTGRGEVVWLDDEGAIVGPTEHVPLWSVSDLPYAGAVIAFALPPLLWLGTAGRRRFVARRRRRRGRCVGCGYDLRGGHTACPECGSTT